MTPLVIFGAGELAEVAWGYFTRAAGPTVKALTVDAAVLSSERWHAYRGAAYRIGYAESAEGLTWTRRDERVGLEPSPSGWDSEAVCYPGAFHDAGQQFLLDHGNGDGLTGFGLAVLDSDHA